MLLWQDLPAGGSVRYAARLYSLSPNAPTVSEVCDYDGSKLVVRDDDREEVVTERLKAYDRQTSPVLEYFRTAGYRLLGSGWRRGPRVVRRRLRSG